MKIEKTQFVKYLSMLKQFVDSKGVIELSKCILFDIDNSVLTMRATNFVTGQTLTVPVDSDEKFCVAVPFEKMFSYVKKLSNCEIEIELLDSQLVIRSGAAEYSIQTIDASDFPADGFELSDNIISASCSHISDALKQSSVSSYRGSDREHLNSVLLEVIDGKIICVSTDGHRLTSVSYNTESSDTIQLLLRLGFINTMFKLLTAYDSELSYSDEKILIRSKSEDGCEIKTYSMLQIGSFPDWRQVIPKSVSNNYIISTSELRSVIDRALASAPKNEPFMALKFDNSHLTVDCSDEISTFSETIAVSNCDDEKTVSINGKYLFDLLSIVDTDEINIGVESELDPVLLITDNITGIIMPIRR